VVEKPSGDESSADKGTLSTAAEKAGDKPEAGTADRPGRGSTASASAKAATGLLGTEKAAEFKGRWRELQGDFVDDPQQAVRGAGELARDVLQALSDKIAAAERVESWKAEDGTSGTEDLRVALRQYRTLVDRLVEL
jgi:hypothetical protein